VHRRVDLVARDERDQADPRAEEHVHASVTSPAHLQVIRLPQRAVGAGDAEARSRPLRDAAQQDGQVLDRVDAAEHAGGTFHRHRAHDRSGWGRLACGANAQRDDAPARAEAGERRPVLPQKRTLHRRRLRQHAGRAHRIGVDNRHVVRRDPSDAESRASTRLVSLTR